VGGSDPPHWLFITLIKSVERVGDYPDFPSHLALSSPPFRNHFHATEHNLLSTLGSASPKSIGATSVEHVMLHLPVCHRQYWLTSLDPPV